MSWVTSRARTILGDHAVDRLLARHGPGAEERLRVALGIRPAPQESAQEPAQEPSTQESAQEPAQEPDLGSRIKTRSRTAQEPGKWIFHQESPSRQTAPWKPVRAVRSRIYDEEKDEMHLAEFGAACKYLPSGSPQQFGCMRRGRRR